QLVGSPRHADVLLVNGSINKKDRPRLLEIYHQAAKPVLVVAIGACGCTGGIFKEGYPNAGPVDEVIPVDAYIPGCPPKPEAIIAGIVKLITRKSNGKPTEEQKKELTDAS
ncbi:MAG: NADH-quinone oxidoreductase subunit B, partial [Cyclobacteriaceae bacterium]|nr:NADH-quinone oxidoreductase subunit B [Cyclobacteriaceae bacterium]